MADIKLCAHCHGNKTLEEFRIRKDGYYDAWCRSCRKVYRAKWWHNNADKVALYPWGSYNYGTSSFRDSGSSGVKRPKSVATKRKTCTNQHKKALKQAMKGNENAVGNPGMKGKCHSEATKKRISKGLLAHCLPGSQQEQKLGLKKKRNESKPTQGKKG